MPIANWLHPQDDETNSMLKSNDKASSMISQLQLTSPEQMIQGLFVVFFPPLAVDASKSTGKTVQQTEKNVHPIRMRPQVKALFFSMKRLF